MNNKELDILIQECKEGNSRSQDTLVRTFAPVMLGVCRRYCGDNELAKDALQECFYNVFRYLKTYSGSGSFEGWMRRIAVNSSYRLLKKIQKVQFESGLEQDSRMPTEVPVVFAQMEIEKLMNFIAKLPKGQHLIFNMYVIEGFSHKEIAKVLGISSSTSRSNLARARVKLRKMMEEYEESSDVSVISHLL